MLGLSVQTTLLTTLSSSATCRCRDTKQAAISYVYGNLKNIDVDDFEQHIRSFKLFFDPVDPPD